MKKINMIAGSADNLTVNDTEDGQAVGIPLLCKSV